MNIKKYIYIIISLILSLSSCDLNNTISQKENQVQSENIENLKEDSYYYSLEDVSYYLNEYHKLPNNYITKARAKKLGRDKTKNSLRDVADKMVIGGDYFGNYEGLLPDGDYKEADVNYNGGPRGDERIVYDEDFNIYYTNDHYNSFKRIDNDSN